MVHRVYFPFYRMLLIEILKRHVKNTNHHILDRAFLQHLNVLQTVRLHLEGGFGVMDPVYVASRFIRQAAPSFFSTAVLGISQNFDDLEEELRVNDDETQSNSVPIEEKCPCPMTSNANFRFVRIGKKYDWVVIGN